MKLFFEFDPQKASNNRRKHGISFTEAMTVFSDQSAQTFPDEFHQADEERWITLGLSSAGRLLFLSHLEAGSSIRIIGARRATAQETSIYEELKGKPSS